MYIYIGTIVYTGIYSSPRLPISHPIGYFLGYYKYAYHVTEGNIIRCFNFKINILILGHPSEKLLRMKFRSSKNEQVTVFHAQNYYDITKAFFAYKIF